jgi:hypothetical protein
MCNLEHAAGNTKNSQATCSENTIGCGALVAQDLAIVATMFAMS